MVLPLIDVAKTQCPPLWTLRMTMWPAARADPMLAFETFPWQEIPNELTDPQTKRSPLTYPPCPLSQVLRVLGLQLCPVPDSAMATELMRHPALQIVLEEVPSCSFPHLESHCLQRGQDLLRARARSRSRQIILAAIVDILSIMNVILNGRYGFIIMRSNTAILGQLIVLSIEVGLEEEFQLTENHSHPVIWHSVQNTLVGHYLRQFIGPSQVQWIIHVYIRPHHRSRQSPVRPIFQTDYHHTASINGLINIVVGYQSSILQSQRIDCIPNNRSSFEPVTLLEPTVDGCWCKSLSYCVQSHRYAGYLCSCFADGLV